MAPAAKPPGTGAPEEGPARLRRLLRAARGRSILAATLGTAFAAAALNETARWASVGFVALTRREIPIFDLGPLFLLAVYPLLRRRWSLAATARRADALGGLRDRLVSFVDFSGRADIPARVREAQAREAARAAGALPLATLAPLPARLAAGPLLLLASVLYPFLFLAGTGPETATVRVAQRMLPGAFRQPRAPAVFDPAAPPDGSRPRDREPKGAARTGDDARPERRPEPAAKQGAQATPGEHAALPHPERARPPRARPEARPEREQPSQIVSERVGAGLAKLVDPVYDPERRAAEPAPSPAGAFAFRLLPKKTRAGSGAGDAATETAHPERVTVDFDALPEQYRALVRAYFQQLESRREAPAAPARGRSTAP